MGTSRRVVKDGQDRVAGISLPPQQLDGRSPEVLEALGSYKKSLKKWEQGWSDGTAG